jgi:hypothetical protein
MALRTSLADLVAAYPAEVQDLVLHTRALILECVPGAEETVDMTGRVIGYGFGPGYKGVVCTIIPSKTGVKLGIPYGANFADPKHLLEGNGKVHRHVALRRVADLDRAGVKALLRAAHAAWKQRGKEKA